MGGGIDIDRVVHRRKRLGQCLGVAGGRGRCLKLAARIEHEPAGCGIAAGAGVVIESALVGAAVVVDDGRAQMIAVAQGRAADAADYGVNRLDAGFALERHAGPRHLVAQFVHQRIVDLLGLVGGRSGIGVLDASASPSTIWPTLARVHGRIPRKTLSTKPSE